MVMQGDMTNLLVAEGTVT